MRKIKWRTLIVSVLIPLIIGGFSALLTAEGMRDFDSFVKPPLSPPGWLFPVVWTSLYILMGVASYIVIESTASREEKERALGVYLVQLVFNFLWSIIFFSLGLYYFAFIWLLALLVLIIISAWRFFKIDKTAGVLIIPYIIWVIFAGYLNLAIAYLN